MNTPQARTDSQRRTPRRSSVRALLTIGIATTLAVALSGTSMLLAAPPGGDVTPASDMSQPPAAGTTSQTPSTTTRTAVRNDWEPFLGKTHPLILGWNTCAAITYSADVRALRAAQRARETRRIRKAMQQWSQATGITVTWLGRQAVTINHAGTIATIANGVQTTPRHVHIAMVREKTVDALVDPVAGLAVPTGINAATGEITGGLVMLRAKHVRKLSGRDGHHLKGLYLHEIGHVFGLGHAHNPANIMYPAVQQHDELGPGDRNGARTLTRPCTQDTLAT